MDVSVNVGDWVILGELSKSKGKNTRIRNAWRDLPNTPPFN